MDRVPTSLRLALGENLPFKYAILRVALMHVRVSGVFLVSDPLSSFSPARHKAVFDAYRHRSIPFHQITFSHSLKVILAHSRRCHQRTPKSRGSLAAATDQ